MLSTTSAAVLAGIVLASLGHSAPTSDDQDTILQDVKYIWPVTTWTVPLSPASGNYLMHPSLAVNLSKIATRAFDKYVAEVLPRELKADPAFKAEFEASDHSRMNHAFLRWQKRVYANLKRIPLQELSWDGSPIPQYKDVPYSWKSFYKSIEYKELKGQLERLAGMYLSNFDRRQRRGRGLQFRTFIWAEIYRLADSHRPLAYTGAPVAGAYFAKYSAERGRAQKFAFEDPRGINPPFGKTHNYQPKQGDVLMHPSWASNFLTPHLLNSTNVVFRFVCWPPDGPPEFDWEDDESGGYIYSKQFKIKKPQEKPRLTNGKTEL